MAAQVSLQAIPAAPTTLRLVAPPGTAPAEPLWLATTWDAAKHEVASYFRTAWAFGTRPQATARAWAERRFQALNPLAYLLNSLAIIGPWHALWQRILGLPEGSFTQDLVAAVTPFVGVLAVGSIHHLLFRLLGSKRHIQSSWAISIYSTGGLPTLVSLVATPFALRLQHLKTPSLLRAHWHEIALLQAFGIVTLVMQNAALSGLYSTTRRRAACVQIASSVMAVLTVTIVGTQLMLIGNLLKLVAGRL